MSTVAEIKAAISQLPHEERLDLILWLARLMDLRVCTCDGLDLEAKLQKILEAEKGAFRTVDPKEQIAKLIAALDEGFIDPAPENIARIQRKLDEVDQSKCRAWTDEDWAKLGVQHDPASKDRPRS